MVFVRFEIGEAVGVVRFREVRVDASLVVGHGVAVCAPDGARGIFEGGGEAPGLFAGEVGEIDTCGSWTRPGR